MNVSISLSADDLAVLDVTGGGYDSNGRHLWQVCHEHRGGSINSYITADEAARIAQAWLGVLDELRALEAADDSPSSVPAPEVSAAPPVEREGDTPSPKNEPLPGSVMGGVL